MRYRPAGVEISRSPTGSALVFTNANTIVRLRVNNKLIVKSIINVIGTINGREEPDRYVLVGNHRDAEFLRGG